MYEYLFKGCIEHKEQPKHTTPDKINRRCNKYAVKHTANCWKAQYGRN